MSRMQALDHSSDIAYVAPSLIHSSKEIPAIPHICHFFTQAKILDRKFYTEERVNYGKRISRQNHCSHIGPHLGTLVPMGTKMSFLVPIWSQFIFKVPIFSISDLRTRQKSVQPLSNVNHEITCGNKN